MAQLSEYEKQRLENIRKNQEILAKLNIVSPPAMAAKLVPKRPAARIVHKSTSKSGAKESSEPVRRSQRIQEKILDNLDGKSKRKKKEIAFVEISPKASKTVTRQKPIIGAIPFCTTSWSNRGLY